MLFISSPPASVHHLRHILPGSFDRNSTATGRRERRSMWVQMSVLPQTLRRRCMLAIPNARGRGDEHRRRHQRVHDRRSASQGGGAVFDSWRSLGDGHPVPVLAAVLEW